MAGGSQTRTFQQRGGPADSAHSVPAVSASHSADQEAHANISSGGVPCSGATKAAGTYVLAANAVDVLDT